MKGTKRNTISRNEYLQLLGLKTLAIKHNKDLESIRQAMIEITAEEDEQGHTADTVWDNEQTVDTMLFNLEIEVVDILKS